MSISSVSDPTLFKRPYAGRRRRDAAKRRPASAVSKLLRRVLVVLLLLLVATLTVIFKDSEPHPVAAGTPQLEDPLPIPQ